MKVEDFKIEDSRTENFNSVDNSTLTLGLLALQFAAFAWRIDREVRIEGKGDRTWFPASDWLNIASLFAVTFFCIVWPSHTGVFSKLAKTILVTGYALIAFYPVSQAAHYGLFSAKGRSIYTTYPWITYQEKLALVVSVAAATLTAYSGWHTRDLVVIRCDAADSGLASHVYAFNSASRTATDSQPGAPVFVGRLEGTDASLVMTFDTSSDTGIPNSFKRITVDRYSADARLDVKIGERYILRDARFRCNNGKPKF